MTDKGANMVVHEREPPPNPSRKFGSGMKRNSRRGWIAILGGPGIWSAAAMAAALLPGPTPALSADIQVFVSGAPAEAAKRIAAKFTASTGQGGSFSVANLADIRKKLADGGRPDIVVLPVDTMDALDKSGALEAGSQVVVARVGIGLTVREGARLPDISTVDAVRKTLLAARSIVYPDPVGGGQTGAHLARVMGQLGIADQVKPKTTLQFAIGGGVAMVADGKSEVGLFNISEILPVRGVTLVGPLPAELQSYITFSAAAFHVAASSREPALAFLHALVDPQAGDIWRQTGFEPLASSR
jgi:molybdate transport system substrate-binding protein